MAGAGGVSRRSQDARPPLSHFTTAAVDGGSIWYDNADLWVHGEFEHDGSKVQYQLDS